MIESVYFDTNIFYDVKQGKISDKDWRMFLTKCSSNNIRCYFSPISFVEIASHINNEEKAEFDYFKDILRIMHNSCGKNYLDDPDTFLRRLLAKGVNVDFRKVEWGELCRIIAETDTFETLTTGQIVRLKWQRARVIFKAEYLKRFREEYEQEYVSNMLTNVINTVHPQYKELKLGKKLANVKDAKLRKELVKFIDGDEFRQEFLRSVYWRAGVGLVGDIGKNPVDCNSIESLYAFFSAYKWILKNIFEAGYNIEKQKNDYNDIHLLIYLASEQFLFITHDNHLRGKVGDCTQKKRILKFQEAEEKIFRHD